MGRGPSVPSFAVGGAEVAQGGLGGAAGCMTEAESLHLPELECLHVQGPGRLAWTSALTRARRVRVCVPA